MGSFHSIDWDATSTIVTAIGILVALAIGVHANIIQRNQVKDKQRQERVLAKAWASALAVEIANSLALLKKIYIEYYENQESIEFTDALLACEKINQIYNPILDRVFERLDVFDIEASRSISAFHSEILRMKHVSEMIKNEKPLYFKGDVGHFKLMKEWLSVVIQHGEVAMRSMYRLSEIGVPPDLDAIVKRAVHADKLIGKN